MLRSRLLELLMCMSASEDFYETYPSIGMRTCNMNKLLEHEKNAFLQHLEKFHINGISTAAWLTYVNWNRFELEAWCC